MPRPTKQTLRPRKKRQPMLAAEVEYVDYKDLTLLRTFLSDRGKIRPRRVTGISPQQQRAVTRAIKNARELALIPYANPRRRKTS